MRGNKNALPRVLIRNITLPVIRFGLIIGVVAVGLREVGIAGAYLFAHIGAALLGLYYLSKYTSLLDAVKPKYKHRRLVVFSGPLVISAAMGFILQDIDTLLLGYFVSSADVGIYRVVYPLGELMLIFLNSISFIFLPMLSELHADGELEEMKQLYQLITKWLFILSFPILLVWIMFPSIFIRVIFGGEYSSGGSALAVLAVGFFIHATVGLNSNTITSIGETKLIPIVNLIAAVTNLGLNLVLIPRYSFFGAAVATTISYLVLNGLFSILLYRMTGIHPFGRSVLRIGGAVGIITIGLYLPLHRLLEPTVESIVIAGLVFLPIYVSTIFFTGGVSESEKEVVVTLQSRLGVSPDDIREYINQK
jgi:O-antigen/teichoic acid export membrane protein